MTSVVILICVLNKKREYLYKASARVILHDPIYGTLLFESDTEERQFEEGRDRVKFEVGVGSQANIEQCRSKKLKLQVKVRVMQQAVEYWQMVYPQHKKHTSHAP